MIHWIAFGIVVGQGIIAIILLRVMHTFGVYAETLLAAQKQNIEIRRNLAIQQNEMVIQEILKHQTPPPLNERQA